MSYYGPMSLRDAVLAALLEGESSGYDLAKDFDASVANFWMATPQQLYRELERLAEQGLIQARIVEQERRPNKRMFSLTEAGYDAIRQFTGRPPKPSAIRDELLIKVQALRRRRRGGGPRLDHRTPRPGRGEGAALRTAAQPNSRRPQRGGVSGHRAADGAVSDADARDFLRGRKRSAGPSGRWRSSNSVRAPGPSGSARAPVAAS